MSNMSRRSLAAVVLLALAVGLVGPAHAAGPALAVGGAAAQPLVGKFYEYAPAIVVDAGVKHVFACANVVAGEIRDHIVHHRYVGGREVATDVALRPAEEKHRFDSFHVCDPEIVAGSFFYRGHVFRFALLYTGNDKPLAKGNRLGMALADTLDGPWQRTAEPVVSFDFGGDEKRSWGVGQPAAVNPDHGDGFLLFYTEGASAGTRTLVSSVRMSAEGGSPMVVGAPRTVPTAGLRQADGKMPDFLNDAAIAYLPGLHEFIAVRPVRPMPSTPPTMIEARQEIDILAEEALAGDDGKIWRKLTVISPALTKAPRNHNGGIVKDIWGGLPRADRIGVVVTTSDDCAAALPCFPTALWSYRLHELDFPLPASP
jgi:hypothetical protein